MILQFATKPDICGNIYRLEINTEKKTYNTNFIGGQIRVTRKELSILLKQCINDNYKDISFC